ncbi:MAG: aminoglycoside phosphotransferase family protein [Planctomycetota bacterium]|nr:aminoglycoside phosphotransferase family protein [Planctomycetota bacterium]
MKVARAPLPITGLPGFVPLFEGSLWASWSAWVSGVRVLDGVTPADWLQYLRLKPGVSCRLAFFPDLHPAAAAAGTPNAGPPEGILVHLFDTPERAERAFAKFVAHRARDDGHGAEPFLDRGAAAVVASMLDDPELPGLRHLRRPYRVKTWLERAFLNAGPLSKRTLRYRMLRYKPGRRGAFEVGIAPRSRAGTPFPLRAHLRIERPSDALRTLERMRALRERLKGAAPHVEVPEVLWADPDSGVSVRAWLEGTVEGDAWSLDRARRVGAALASLHAVDPAACALPAFDPEREWVEPVRNARALLPDPGTAAERLALSLAETFAARDPSRDVAIHGDLHPGQVVFRDEGVGWLDLDRARRAPAAFDFASLRVQAGLGFDSETHAAVRHGYREAGREPPAESEIVAAETAIRLGRWSDPFRRLDPDWPTAMRRAFEQLESAR